MRPLPRAQQDQISLVDAGIAYNLGFESLLRRKSAIIIVLDYLKNAGELKKAEDDLRARGFKLPPINHAQAENQIVSVFKDPNDLSVPIIIYMPQIKNVQFPQLDPKSCVDSWCGTFELSYPQEKSRLLIAHSKKNMEDALPVIFETIRQWIAQKSGKVSLVSNPFKKEPVTKAPQIVNP